MEIKNAVIEKAILSTGDHGMLSSWLMLDYGGCGQGFGGYALYLPKSCKHHHLESVAGHWIWRCMEIAGVDRWEDLQGKTIRVKSDHSSIKAIGHILNDDWFDPRLEFAEVNKENK